MADASSSVPKPKSAVVYATQDVTVIMNESIACFTASSLQTSSHQNKLQSSQRELSNAMDSVNTNVKRLLEYKVNVVTNDGLTFEHRYQGILKTYDCYLNIVLEQCVEISLDRKRELGFHIIKGDAICAIGPVVDEREPHHQLSIIDMHEAPTPDRFEVVDVNAVYGVFADLYTPASPRTVSNPQMHSGSSQMHGPGTPVVQKRNQNLALPLLGVASDAIPIVHAAHHLQPPMTTQTTAPLPPSKDGPNFKRHVSTSRTPVAIPPISAMQLSAAASGHVLDGNLFPNHGQVHAVAPPVAPPTVTVQDNVQSSDSKLSQQQAHSSDSSHLFHMMELQNQFLAYASASQSKSSDITRDTTLTTLPNIEPSKHKNAWPNRKIRNAFFMFLFAFVICCAADVLLDVIFGVESYRVIVSDVSSSSFMRSFFPATVVFLVASFAITTYTNFRAFRRFVLVSASEHQLESNGKSLLIWQELIPTTVVLFRTILCASVASARKSMIANVISVHDWFFVQQMFLPHLTLSKFFKEGLGNIISAFVHLPKTIPATLKSVANLFSLSVTEQSRWHDLCDDETLFPEFVSVMNERIIRSCVSGVAVEFCDSAALTENADGYLTFLSNRVVRPIGKIFNFRTRLNPDEDIEVFDPIDCGYFERVTKWWNNYEEWLQSTIISYTTFFPFCFLAVFLLLVQITSSLILTALHFTAMVLQLLALPILVPLGYPSGVFVSFCQSVKYMTGAIFFFSPKMPGFHLKSGSVSLKIFSPHCRGISNLHEFHVSAFQMGNIPFRFKIAALITGIPFFIIRFVILKLVSFIICSFCWVFLFVFKLCLGLLQIVAFVVSAILSMLLVVILVLSTLAYIILCPFTFLFAAAILFTWFFISIFALFGMELICFVAAITNPEAGLILFDNVTDMRFNSSVVAGFIEAIPCLILQAYYTSVVGTRGVAGSCRIVSIAYSIWRICIVTARFATIFIRYARDKQWSHIPSSKFLKSDFDGLAHHHSVVMNILFNFRASLFPDRFSAFLRLCIFGMFAGLFGWLGYHNLYDDQGLSSFMQTNFPAPVVCDSFKSFSICDVNARCIGDECVCNAGYGGNGERCIQSRPGTCKNAVSPCGYASTCEDTSGGYTCPCPSWTTAPPEGSAFYGNGNSSSLMCLCDSVSFPNLDIGKKACVTTSNLTQGEVAAIMIFAGYIPLVLMFLVHWRWSVRGGAKYPSHWKWIFSCLLLVLISVSVGLYLGGVTSIMLLVICVPIVLIFLVHWNWRTRDGSVYPTKWKIAFAIICILLLCLSLGFMLGNTVNANIDKIRNQAAIVIFAVCVPIVLSFFLYWQYSTRGGSRVWSKKERKRRIIIFFIVFLAIFALILGCIMGISTQPTFEAFAISASDRKAGKIGATVTVSFTPISPVPSDGTITLRYPPFFFATGVTPVLAAGSSSVGSLAGICSATTETHFVITTAGATIPAGAVVMTIRGFTMGGLSAGAADVTIQTSADTKMSLNVHSGGIFPPITDINFNIQSADRVSGKSGARLTLEFTPANPIPPGGTITLFYPPSFFATSVIPKISSGNSSVADLSAACGPTTATSLIITIVGATISPTPFKVTIEGMTMGAITSGSAVKIETSSDILPSPEVHSGGIFTQVTSTTFQISSSDRIAGRPGVAVTLSFTPTTPVVAGGTLTLNYPNGFFAQLITPNIAVGSSNIASFTATCGPTAASSIVITTAGANINSSTFLVTISGFKMGAVTLGGVVTVQTSSDALPSVEISSGAIKGQVSGLVFGIASSQRISGNTNVALTLSFSPFTPIPIGGAITLAFPSNFFAPSITPLVNAGSSSVPGLTGACSNTSSPFIIITTVGAQIPAALFTVTITGFTMGGVTAGSLCTVQTSRDVLPSLAVDSGPILGSGSSFMTSPSFAISPTDRIAGKTNVSITIGFTPTTALPQLSTITIRYPTDFFAASVTPTVVAGSSSVSALTASCSSTTATFFVITTAGAVIPTTATVITIGGVTIGGVNPGALQVTFESSTDTVPSAAVASGQILGQISFETFGIRLQNRLVGTTAVPVTISFSSPSSLPIGGTITLSYPSGFFVSSIVPSVSAGSASINGLSMLCSPTTSTGLILTVAGVPIPASTAAITISGFVMGAATSGGAVYLQSSADTVPSLSLSSGAIFGQVKNVLFVIASSDRIAGKDNVKITIGFSPSSAHNAGSAITITYPSAFFASTLPTVGTSDSSISGLTFTCSASTTTSFVLTTSGVSISAGAAVTVTVSGLKMGAATSGSVGVFLATSADTSPSVAVSSGSIFTQVTFVSMSISSSDRIANRNSVPVTLGFAVATPLPVGGNITLNYPTDFFAPGIAIAFMSSSVAGLMGVCSATSSTSVVITTAAVTIPSSAVVITIGGFKMGSVTLGSIGVSVQTSTDTAVSEAVSSGRIDGQVAAVSFNIQSADRIAHRTPVSVTIGFTANTAVPIGGTITLNFPSGFFAPSITPSAISVGSSSVAQLSGICGSTTATNIVITTASAPIPAAPFVVTIAGFQVGSVASNSVGVSIQTSSDTLPSLPVASGAINGQVAALSFEIASSDRIVAKSGVPVTLGFILSTSLSTGGTITLNFPAMFFAASSPTVQPGSSSVAGFTATCSNTTSTSVIISSTGATVFASSFVVTLSGFVMGGATAGSTSVTVQTSADTAVSSPVFSGSIATQVTAVSFVISSGDRIALKSSVPITLGFTPATSLLPGGTITLTYPNGFFAPSVTPLSFSSGNSNVANLVGSCGQTTANYVVITTAAATIPPAPFVVTISGFKMGIAQNPSNAEILVQTSVDTAPSSPVPSGAIVGQVTAVSFNIMSSDRVVSKSMVTLTIGFTPTTPIPIGGKITISYPPNFFASSITPTIQSDSSSVLGLAGTCDQTGSSSFVITTSGAAIAASAFIVTVGGLTMGNATSGSNSVTVQTSEDSLPSTAISSGSIGNQVTSVSFLIATLDRMATKTSVPVTLGFTPTTPLNIGASITLSFPSGFFATGVRPTLTSGNSNVASLAGTCSFTAASYVVITTSGAAIPAASAVTLTINGFTMGSTTFGAVGVFVRTSSDISESSAVASGAIYGYRRYAITVGNWVYSTVTDVPITVTSASKTTHADNNFLPIPSMWQIAPDDAETRNIIRTNPFSTDVVVLSNGVAIRTSQYFYQGNPGSQYCHLNPCPNYILTDSQGRVACADYNLQILIRRAS